MAQQKASGKNFFEGKIPEETRQHFRSAHEEIHKSFEGILPPEFMEHRKNAKKEFLMAWRSLIDATLERMETPKK